MALVLSKLFVFTLARIRLVFLPYNSHQVLSIQDTSILEEWRDVLHYSEREGAIGIVKGNGETENFQLKANFSLVIIARVEGSKDGYIARITRAPDNVTR